MLRAELGQGVTGSNYKGLVSVLCLCRGPTSVHLREMRAQHPFSVATLSLLMHDAAEPSPAVELISNGNFETFSGGNPTSWSYTQGDGPATLQNSANSPFVNIYSGGANDLL